MTRTVGAMLVALALASASPGAQDAERLFKADTVVARFRQMHTKENTQW